MNEEETEAKIHAERKSKREATTVESDAYFAGYDAAVKEFKALLAKQRKPLETKLGICNMEKLKLLGVLEESL